MLEHLNYRKKRLISAVATAMSAIIVLSGGAVRTGVYAAAGYEDKALPIVTEEVGIGIGRSSGEAEAQSVSAPEEGRRGISVYIDGESYGGRAFLYNEVTYVGIRQFCETLAGASVSWDDATGTATAVSEGVTVSAAKGAEYITANGRYLWVKDGILIQNGLMYVPIRVLCKAYGADLEWNGEDYSVKIERGNGEIVSGSEFYDTDAVYWLSKIIHAESRGEVLTGKIAVGNVVLNRVRSNDYPDTIYGVIFDRKYGVQFSPIADGSINLEPDEESVAAAKLCLEGYTVSDTILFFINTDAAESLWVSNNRPFAVSIGNHDFYA